MFHRNRNLNLILKLMPENVRPYAKDYCENFLPGLGPKKRGPKTPLWDAPPIECAARMMGQLIKEEGLSRKAAADRVLVENSPMFSGIKRQALINQYSGNSGMAAAGESGGHHRDRAPGCLPSSAPDGITLSSLKLAGTHQYSPYLPS